MLADGTRCKGTRRDGSPCKGLATGSSGLCWAHDPANQERVRAARSAGGHAKSRAARIERLMPNVLRPVLERLLTALEEVHEGRLTARQAEAMSALSTAICRVYEIGALEERLEALEGGQPGGRIA